MTALFLPAVPGVEFTAVYIGAYRARHVATMTCKRTGRRNAVFCHEAAAAPANDDDENIIDPYGSGPVPIVPKRAV